MHINGRPNAHIIEKQYVIRAGVVVSDSVIKGTLLLTEDCSWYTQAS